MRLALDDAVAITALLPVGVRARMSMRSVTGPRPLARYVRFACEAAAARGAWLDAAGGFHVGERAEATPAESEAHALALAVRPDAKPLLKALDRAMRDALTEAERGEALARSLYDAGLALDIDIGSAEPDAQADPER